MSRSTRSGRNIVPVKRKHSDSSEDECGKFESVRRKNTKLSGEIAEKKDEKNYAVSKMNKTKQSKQLLSLSEKFELLLSKVEEISRKVCLGSVVRSTEDNKFKKNVGKKKRHNSDRDDDEMDNSTKRFVFSQSPPFINGKMRDYQIFGLNWLLSLRENNINGILADEMGLGKTLQTISLIAYVKFFESKITGVENNLPSIIIVPLSTLYSWENEFKRWTNGMRVVVLHGDREKRKKILENDLVAGKYDVALTTYEMFSAFGGRLKKTTWEYVVIDEAHRIKNEETILANGVRRLNAKNRLLLTGTPLQNNLHELWSLLNFLQPELFDNVDDFDDWFDSGKCLFNNESVVKKLHKILQPFMLRRIKKDVEKGLLPKKETTLFVGLSNVQKELYKKILLKDSEMLINGKIAKAKLLGIMQQLRKVASHPYLFPEVEPGPPYIEGEHILTCCGKLNVLDKLLVKLKMQGSRVLIFTQFLGTLDILEDYMSWKGFSYHRLDGSTSHNERQEYIDEFQSEKSKTFAFLISTRAGGLGITLTAADIVIFYDIDWNPQMDLQAADRAHRIGQKKEVKVFRIIAEGTVDERIYETAEKKLRLDNLIIQKGRMSEMKKDMDKNDIMEIIRNGVSVISDDNVDQNELNYKIEEIIEKSTKKYAMLKEKFDTFGKPQDNMVFDGQQHSDNNYSVYKFEGDDYKILQKLSNAKADEENISERRMRRQRFETQIKNEEPKQNKMPTISKNPPFPPDFIQHQDYFLCDSEYINLVEKYLAFYRKCQNFSYFKGDGQNVPEKIKEKQNIIDNAKPLSDLEIKRMNQLKNVAFFSNWNSHDFSKIKRIVSNVGMDFKKIHLEMQNYDIQEIEKYVTRLIKYAEENNLEKFLAAVEKAESKRIKKDMFMKFVDELFRKAKGDPMKVNLPMRIYSKRNRGVIKNKNIELDKHVFYHFVSEMKKNNMNLKNLSTRVVMPFVTWRFVLSLKRNVNMVEDFELTCDSVVKRFLYIIHQLENMTSTDFPTTTNSIDFNNLPPEKQNSMLNKLLLRPCMERNYIIKNENCSINIQSENSVISFGENIIQSNAKMLKTKKTKSKEPFLSNNGGVLREVLL